MSLRPVAVGGRVLRMVQADDNAGLPIRGRPGVNPKGSGPRIEKTDAIRKAEREELAEQSRSRHPGFRTAAWLIAIVVIVMVAGWAIAWLLRAVT
jgi:hypothetical protein